MDLLKRAKELEKELIETRRTLHKIAEVGFDLPNTRKLVKEKLEEMGYTTKELGGGIVTTIGKGEKCILLRADMDALPFEEKADLPFKATNGNMHACGHDMHTTMLLGAAKMLKEVEQELKCTVKLMFQPAEELLTGSKKMIEEGVLENPKVDAAIMFHVWPIDKEGIYTRTGSFHAGNNNFDIKLKGVGSHGALPQEGRDPVYAGAQIIIGLQSIVTREVPLSEAVLITTGHFEGGSAPNVISDSALIQGTLRTFSDKSRKYAKERIVEITEGIAKTFRVEAEVTFTSDVPVLVNDEEVTNCVTNYLLELYDGKYPIDRNFPQVPGSEDFANITHQVPSCMMWLGLKKEDEKEVKNLHHPEVILHEDMLYVGAASFVQIALRWGEEHSN